MFEIAHNYQYKINAGSTIKLTLSKFKLYLLHFSDYREKLFVRLHCEYNAKLALWKHQLNAIIILRGVSTRLA